MIAGDLTGAQLRAALELERRVAASEKNAASDPKYLEARKSLEAIRKQVNVMKEERALQAEMKTSVRAHEESKKQKDEDEAYIKNRFGESTSNNNKQ